MNEQYTSQDIFSMMHPKIKLTGKIRMFEAFSGIGTQAMALKRVTNDYEIVGISEIDKYAITSYRAIHGDVKNYGDITKMTEIPPCDIFTWSFPCTDLSKAGKQKGLQGGTRSGLVYEVLRLVKDTKVKPRVLVMENVVDLIQTKFVREFGEIQLELERMGYMNYVEVMNAKEHGVAQNRERVFMVSVLGEYSYQFPKNEKLEKRLKDYLEPVVDEKYYIDDYKFFKMINENYGELNGGKWENVHDITKRVYTDDNVSPTIHTMQGGNLQPKVFIKSWNDETKAYKTREDDMPRHRIYETDSIGFAITTNESQQPSIAIPEATKQGYTEAHDGDGVYINRPHQKRGVVQKQMIQTIKTSGDDIRVVVNNKENGFYKQAIDVFNKNNCNYGDVILAFNEQVDKSGCSPTITTRPEGKKTAILPVTHDLRIRKLTPRECWRLMDISDDDFDKASKVCSNSQLYKQAGNAIVVRVFEKILKELLLRKD